MEEFEQLLISKGFEKFECFGGTFNYVLIHGKYRLSVNSALPWLYKMYSVDETGEWFEGSYNIPRSIQTLQELEALIKIFIFLHS